MIISVVACGQSAEGWYKTPCDLSIGCNDMFKWGVKPNILGVWNHPGRFIKERLDIILKTRPVKLYTFYDAWNKYFDDVVMTKTRSYDGILRKDCGRLTSADTSPIIAMSLAYCLGASKIIVWGADFKNHKTYSSTNPQTKLELRQYQGYTNLLRAAGVDVFLGAPGSAMESFLPIYENIQV